MNQLNVLHVITNFAAGGIEKWLIDFENVCNKHYLGKLNCEFLCIGGSTDAWDHQVSSKKIYSPNLKKGRLAFFLKLFSFARENRNTYSVIHIHPYRFSAFIAFVFKIAGCNNIVVHAHNDKRNLYRKYPLGKRLIYNAYGLVAKAMFRLSATVCVAASKDAAKDLFGTLSSSKTQIIYCGVQLSDHRSESSRHALMAELNVAENDHVFITVGSLTTQKNHLFLIEEFAKAAQNNHALKLLVIGEGSLRVALERKIQQLQMNEKVILLGNRLDIQSIMQNVAHTFVFPSLYEGLGLAFIEAQFSGLPSIISNTIPYEADTETSLVNRIALEPNVWRDQIVLAERLQVSQKRVLGSNRKFSVEESVRNFKSLYVSL
ncbi:glycosyltransferase family 1 protein [Thalassotalea litorea]|uniref:Glycosyltransferase family 1 protein n=1 Tax=Thalassotalea litorea TaxID=2020715 RepID=A0A5R9IHV0_9GAMM|nr:glycosyltransferase [Thalassotalea litorea]TLU65095.1 glycosyltransferase family 1 protein [Thalassotalea litorea]